MSNYLTQGRILNIPLVISGPSGVGKSTLISSLFHQFPHKFAFSVSCTTRPPRINEKEGEHYYFISRLDFTQKINDSIFIEHCLVHNHLYGTLFSEVEKVTKSGKICVLDIDIQGALKLKARKIPFNGIFIKPKCKKTLEARLRSRSTDSEESIKARLTNSQQELNLLSNNPELYHHIITNDDLTQSKNSLISTVQSSYPHLLTSPT